MEQRARQTGSCQLRRGRDTVDQCGNGVGPIAQCLVQQQVVLLLHDVLVLQCQSDIDGTFNAVRHDVFSVYGAWQPIGFCASGLCKARTPVSGRLSALPLIGSVNWVMSHLRPVPDIPSGRCDIVSRATTDTCHRMALGFAYHDVMSTLPSRWLKELFVDTPVGAARAPVSAAPIIGFGPEPVLVAFATQTGAAESIAEATLEQLEIAGIQAHSMDFYDLDLSVLENTHQMLVVTSTTFDGDPPDMAEPFRDAAMGQPGSLAHLHYALLGLGDRVYDEFCGFGHRLDDWLRASGAQPWFDMIEVDDEDEDAINHWHDRVNAMVDATEPANARTQTA